MNPITEPIDPEEARRAYNRAYAKRRYHADPTYREKAKEYIKKWKLAHPDRVREHEIKAEAKRKAKRAKGGNGQA